MRFIRHLAFFGVGTSMVGLAACTSLLGDFDVSSDSSDGGVAADGAIDSTTGAEGGADVSQGDDASQSDVTQPTDSSTTHDAAEAGCMGTMCGSTCTDTTSDVHHCGVCATDCTLLPHVMSSTGVTCSGGRCVVPAASCETNYAHCTANGSDGCETDLSKSSTCGSCSNVCMSPTGLCTKDTTSMLYHCVSSCVAPSPDLCGSSCTDVMSDPNHCSNCNMACPVVTGGTATCTSGACGVQCNGGNHRCGSSTRCAPDTDVNNCGASCVQCAAPVGGSVTCSSGACAPACPGTQSNCGGTCTDTNTDPNHCGNCAATACAAPKTACAGGACACPGGKTFCSATNTCVDFTNDPLNCGACGHSCLGGTCSASKCGPLQIVSPGIIGNNLNGLSGIVNTGGGFPTTLVMSNCVSGQQRGAYVSSNGMGGVTQGSGMGADYCGHVVAGGSPYVWIAADNNGSTNNIYYSLFIGGFSSTTKVNAASLPSRILALLPFGSGGSGYLGAIVTASPTLYVYSPPGGANASLTTATITAFAGFAAAGLASDGVNYSAYISSPQAGKIVKTFMDNPTAANQTVFMASGGGAPSTLREGVNRLYWSDKAARKFYSMPFAGGTPGDLTSNVTLPDVPDDFLVDGNSIYFWNVTSGRMYVLPADGTATGTITAIAHASAGFSLGSVTTDSVAMYWTESDGGQKGQVWLLAK